jgi:hypothetical protein
MQTLILLLLLLLLLLLVVAAVVEVVGAAVLYNHLIIPKSSGMKAQNESSVENKLINDDVPSSNELSKLPKGTENRISLIDTRWQHQ